MMNLNVNKIKLSRPTLQLKVTWSPSTTVLFSISLASIIGTPQVFTKINIFLVKREKSVSKLFYVVNVLFTKFWLPGVRSFWNFRTKFGVAPENDHQKWSTERSLLRTHSRVNQSQHGSRIFLILSFMRGVEIIKTKNKTLKSDTVETDSTELRRPESSGAQFHRNVSRTWQVLKVPGTKLVETEYISRDKNQICLLVEQSTVYKWRKASLWTLAQNLFLLLQSHSKTVWKRNFW